MFVVISPAKKLDFDTPAPPPARTDTAFADQTRALLKKAKKFSRQDLKNMMKLSDKLADLNFERFQHFDLSGPGAKSALFAFAGDTYRGLDAATLKEDDIAYAQGHLGILSGLYGLLSPLDPLHPYRLEMGTRFNTGRGEDLYSFWGSAIAERLNELIGASGATALVNCASQEYFKAVDTAALNVPVITPVFKEIKGDAPPKIISFLAKQARGMFARHMIENRVTDVAGLRAFKASGYKLDKQASDAQTLTFVRVHG